MNKNESASGAHSGANTAAALLRTPIGTAALVLCAMSPLAQAQESDSSDGALESVLVTAQKRTERLQDVPVPVTAISANTLVENDRVLLKDYYASVPGLSLAPNYGGEQRLAIRGISTGGSSPTVGVTIDDVPYGASTDWGGGTVVPDIDPGDLARVEVLRGPQGTLYGANSMGGLIKYVTVDPSLDKAGGRLELGTGTVRNGNELGYSLRGSGNLPLNDTVAMRVSGFARQEPGYIDNPVTHEDGVNKATAAGGRVALLWNLGADSDLKLTSTYQRTKADGITEVEFEPGLGDLQQNYLPGTGGYERKIQAHSAVFKTKFSSVDFTSISGYNVNDYTTIFDRTFQFGSFAKSAYGVTGAPYHIERLAKKFSQEFRLSGDAGTKVDWLAGAFYTHEKAPYIVSAQAVDTTTQAVVGDILDFNSPRLFTEYAGFAALTYHFTDRFDVQVGGRESHSTLVVSQYDFVGPYTTIAKLGPSPYTNLRAETSSNAFTYLFTPSFKITPDMMVYARFASGYRPGAVNVVTPGVPSGFGPDRTKNYEIGMKADFLGRTLTVDTSVYYIDWSDIQLLIRNPATGLTYTSNGGAAKSEGVELSVTARPFTGTSISGWISYDDAALTENFPPGPLFGLDGDRLSGSPKKSGYLSLNQDIPFGFVTGFIGGDVTYVGDRISTFQSTAKRQVLPAYAQTDLRAGLKYDTWTGSVFVNNVSDRRGVVNGGIGYLPSNAFVYIQPRTIGLNLYKTF